MQNSLGRLPAIILLTSIVAMGQALAGEESTPTVGHGAQAGQEVNAPKTSPIPEEFYRNTYKIRTRSNSAIFKARGFGSGVGVDLEGYGIKGKKYLLTAAHVVFSGDILSEVVEVEVRHPKYKTRMWAKAKVVAYDRSVDIALLEIEIDLPYRAKLASKDLLKRGDVLVATGCPSGTGVTATVGHLSSKYRETEQQRGYWWQGSMPIYYGNSGGPIWDLARKKVVGIAVAGVGRNGLAPNVAFFVSTKSMVNFVESENVRASIKRSRASSSGHESEPADKSETKKKDKKTSPFLFPF